ncbi:nickel transporter [Denitratisoma sp. DHT3]|uniref:HoxN/HupN/NixA family nickel/cobalt transporter n=1 Tax=Denitratisoma sp. DHT3 TaxID=1981880 RepID=UPI0011983441|nr:nickel transporter [Denitratisoma sp. DHT3]QDX80330.1 nickel transporter [Denitratisoma sp. DHT3]
MDFTSDLSAPQTWPALCLLVFALGLRHGFDADHLATIDGLTRYNAGRRPRLARWCGALFSLGHGIVVMSIALAVSAVPTPVPDWLDGFGSGVSIFFLVALGVANLRLALAASPAEGGAAGPIGPIGLKGRWLGGRWLGRLGRAGRPELVVLVGALFALSFDTMSQASLFALVGVRYGGWDHALVLGLLFTLGMLTVDGINGLWIAHLIRRADGLARIASRMLAGTVGLLSLLIAALALARWSLPAVAAWSEGRELAFGAIVVATVAASFLGGWVLAAQRAPAAVD